MGARSDKRVKCEIGARGGLSRAQEAFLSPNFFYSRYPHTHTLQLSTVRQIPIYRSGREPVSDMSLESERAAAREAKQEDQVSPCGDVDEVVTPGIRLYARCQ